MSLYPLLVALVGLVPVLGVASLLFLLLAATLGRRALPPAGDSAPLHLAVIVPAHDEEMVLAATLRSLQAQQYPRDAFEVVVVADNCTDRTAEIAREHGVTVLERSSASERGKGYALNHAITHLLGRPAPPDGFVIVDADTWAAPDFLACMSRRLAGGGDARGFGAWQGRYGVLGGDGWRVALMSGAFDLVNHVKPLGREGLGLSVGLKGNGMAFTRAIAAQVPWAGGSLTEDLDYGLELARRFGLRVGYAPEARVRAQMPAGGAQAASQRSRWERGRARAIKERALPLLAEGLRRRSPLLLDAAWDLLVPPLAELAAFAVFADLLVVLGVTLHLLPHPALWGAAAAATGLGLAVYILGGLRVAEAPPAAYAALARAPFYALWKFVLLARKLRRHESQAWVRTARTPVAPADEAPTSLPSRKENAA